ncbi:hypothetical protein D5F11_022895 [Siminovitchia terrae]|uniref:Uncharacterized protein n=1 Tax=Siminovitchia terrae TaxID=1914933 RepID=A0A429X1J4_SIMTE|nr:transcription termination/antitermination NusG family protein [Siminovitchia terrae]RST57359.1 hypothetical protein D5F11_022895 [Siminovitchia terrae]
MGSFFVLQVHTGFEIEAKEMLQSVLARTNNRTVKSIYAMEKVESVYQTSEDLKELTELDRDEISEHLHAKRLQAGLSNLRHACEAMKRYEDADTLALLDSYRENIRALTKQLKELRKGSKRIGSVLNGYILIETHENISRFPSDLLHIVYSIPKIIGLPSKNNVPQEEVDSFFTQIDISPEIEIELDEFSDVEEDEQVKHELIEQANEVIGSPKEKWLLNRLDNYRKPIEKEIEDILSEYSQRQKEKWTGNPIHSKIQSINVSVRQRKKRIRMPLSLFETVYPNTSIPSKQNVFVMEDRHLFLERLKDLLCESTEKGCVYHE